ERFGEVDWGGSSGGGAPFAEEAAEFDAFPTESSRTSASRGGDVGSDTYGEVALDGSAGGDLALDEEPDRGPVPGGMAQGVAPMAAVHAPVERESQRPGLRVLPVEKRRWSRGAKIGIG